MATVQTTDLFLNNQKRFTEAAVATVPARLSEGDHRLGTGPQFIDPADTYVSYSIPKQAIVRKFNLYVREPFESGTTVSVETIADGTPLFADVAVDAVSNVLSTVTDELFTTTDGFKFTFNQTSNVGVVQVIADYTTIDEKSGKYTASLN